MDRVQTFFHICQTPTESSSVEFRSREQHKTKKPISRDASDLQVRAATGRQIGAVVNKKHLR